MTSEKGREGLKALCEICKSGRDIQHERSRVVGEYGDLSVEDNRLRYIEAMVLSRVAGPGSPQTYALEAAFLNLPHGTMDEVVTASRKLFEAYRERVALILQSFQTRYVDKGVAKEFDSAF